MDLRDLTRPARIGDLIEDPRWGYGANPTREQRWETHERIWRQMAERCGFCNGRQLFADPTVRCPSCKQTAKSDG